MSKKPSAHTAAGHHGLGLWTRLSLCGMFLHLAASAWAFKLSPMEMSFEPTGRGARGVFQVENDSDEPVTVEVSMAQRVMDLDGNDSTVPEEESFSVYPPLIVLGPKKSQAVRVRWLGNPKPKTELAYRIIAEQLPVSLTVEAPGARINLVIRYIGSVYIAPKGVKPDVVVESVSAEKGKDGERKLVIALHNRGTAHTLLDNLELDVLAGGKEGLDKTSVHLKPEELKGMAFENILAGHKRRFVLPWPTGLGDGPLDLKFKFDPSK